MAEVHDALGFSKTERLVHLLAQRVVDGGIRSDFVHALINGPARAGREERPGDAATSVGRQNVDALQESHR